MSGLDEHQLEQAQRQEQREREQAIADARERPARRQITVDGVVVCRSCYEAMPPARLEALPEAALCVDCQQLYEQYGI